MDKDLISVISSLTAALLTVQSSLDHALRQPTAHEGMQFVLQLAESLRPVVEAAAINIAALTAPTLVGDSGCSHGAPERSEEQT